MCLSVPFLIIRRSSTNTNTGGILMVIHFFKNFDFLVFVFTYFTLWLICYRLLILTYQLEGIFICYRFIITNVFTSAFADGLLLESSDSKSQISWTLFRILVDLNNTVVWMVSILPLIFSRHLGIVPSVLTTIFSSLARSKYLVTFSLLFEFSFCGPLKWQHLQGNKFFSLVNLYLILFSDQD